MLSVGKLLCSRSILGPTTRNAAHLPTGSFVVQRMFKSDAFALLKKKAIDLDSLASASLKRLGYESKLLKALASAKVEKISDSPSLEVLVLDEEFLSWGIAKDRIFIRQCNKDLFELTRKTFRSVIIGNP